MRIEDFKDDDEFKSWLRKNGKTIKQFFLEEYNKKDLQTGEPINYANKEQYLSQDFVHKRNLAKWVKTQPQNIAEEYLAQKLAVRKLAGKNVRFPSQVELRSIKELPSANHLIGVVDVERICELAEIEPAFNYKAVPHGTLNIEYFIDTREQKPLKLRKSTVQKLSYGDYKAKNNGLVFVERKSIQDFWGTLSSGYDRFKREIERAGEDHAYLIVMVEYPLTKALSYNHNRKFSKAGPEFIFKQLRTLMQSHKNLQFVFTGGRKESETFLYWLAANEDYAVANDLQYQIDTKGLKL